MNDGKLLEEIERYLNGEMSADERKQFEVLSSSDAAIAQKIAEQKEFLKRGFSRRSFGRLATVLAAGTTLPFYNESALAQLSKVDNVPADAVLINANENPLGPCKEALEAVERTSADLQCRSSPNNDARSLSLIDFSTTVHIHHFYYLCLQRRG